MRILHIALIAAGLMSCGRAKKDDSAPAVPPLSLAGTTWNTDCQPVDTVSYDTIFVFGKDTYTQTYVLYADSACGTIDAETIASYTYSLGDAAQAVPDAFNIDRTITKIVEASFLDASIEDMNKNKSYGFNDWVVGVYKDAAGKSYSTADVANPNIGQKIADIVKVDGDTMTLGFKKDDTQYTERPTSLREEEVFHKE